MNKEGVKFLLTRIAEELLKEGKLDFTFQEMYEKAKEIKVKEREWRTTLLNFLQRFTTGPLGRIFNSKAHIPTGSLLEEQTLFDLSNLINPMEKADFVETFLSHLYECYLKRGNAYMSKRPYLHRFAKTRPGVPPETDCSLPEFYSVQGEVKPESFQVEEPQPRGVKAVLIADEGDSLLCSLSSCPFIASGYTNVQRISLGR